MRNKDRKYLHSEVSVEDIEFKHVFVDKDKINYYKELVDNFNNTPDIELKYKYAENLPKELFGTCRICGKKIINPNSRLVFAQNSGEIFPYAPRIQYRIIDGKKYEISACGKCIEEHFKENPPKSPKYYYMRANKFGAFAYNYSYDEYKKICSATVGVTLQSMIKKWGEEEGKRRWKEYCDKQAITNTFEYKKETYGWDEKKFKEFNKNRAVTKDLCIERHGEEEGLKIWEEYCKRQSYTNSIEYFIERYGEIDGKQKYINFAESRLSQGKSVSCIRIQCIEYLIEKLKTMFKDKVYTNGMYYGEEEYGFFCSENNRSYSIDFYDNINDIIIEFNGTLWHADPKKYSATDIVIKEGTLGATKSLTAQDIWDKDKRKLEAVQKRLPDAKIFIIWESDWKKDPDKAIEPVLEEYTKILNN